MALIYPLYKEGRFIVIFAFGTWLAMAVGFVHSAMQSPVLSTYAYLLGLLSIVGMGGGALYFLGKKYWRFLLILAGASYLVVYGFHFIAASMYLQSHEFSFFSALEKDLFFRWKLFEYYFLDERYGGGAVMMFYEFLMPVYQASIIVLLLWSLKKRSN
jgi:hypothetical protein